MNISRRLFGRLCLCGAAAFLVASTPASALGLAVIPSLIYQSGTSGMVYLGHTVDANTNYNRLVAGGSYTVNCNHPSTLPLSGQRTLSAETFGGPTILIVTIPATLPARQSIPGWSSVPPDTEVSCTYSYTARAVEGGYSIGAFGISFQTGNGERTDGGTLPFRMYKPDRTDDGCIKS